MEWEQSTPEVEGMDASVLEQLDHYMKQKRYRLVNSVLVVKNGKIVLEKYYNKFNANSRNRIMSIWKSIISIAAGISLDQGWIKSLDEPVAAYLPEMAKGTHPYHKHITIRHLLTMSSGIYWNGGVHYHCPMVVQMMRTKDWISHIADIDMEHVPGMKYQYKEWDIMLLSAVIGRAYGGTAYDVVNQYLYEPLEILSGEWPSSPCGFSYHAMMKGEEQTDLSARDLAKIGQLFLNQGLYIGKRIISSEFVKQAITPSFHEASFVSTPGSCSYGMLWWISPEGYGAKGYGGQELIVLPEHRMVTVIQATPTPSSKSYPDIYTQVIRRALS
ncbi:serine hydrolase domain-containing protein [Paenibacillus azoreducens]|nr:serine hydrolase [Paenibacillus azoreducens]